MPSLLKSVKSLQLSFTSDNFNDHFTRTPARFTACNSSETQYILIDAKNSSIGLVDMNDFPSNTLFFQVLRSSKNFKKRLLCVYF
jgi:hypothetical protein